MRTPKGWLACLFTIGFLAGCNDSHDNSPPKSSTTNVPYYADWSRIVSVIPKDQAIEQQIETILSQMTLEEKVGQMIQPDLRAVTPELAKQYKLGSILNGGGAWPNKNKHSTAQDWVDEADKFWQAIEDAYEGRGFRIPFMWATDAVHGHNNVYGATVFPHNIGLGAANDPDLIYEIGKATAKEVAATGLDWTFAPTVAAPRDYRWGRTYEGYSEDPQIIYHYAGRMVDGLQGGIQGLKTDQHVVSNVKHWLGDGGTKDGTDRGMNFYTEEQLINIHAIGYFSGLNAGAQVVMSSFNSWQNDANYDQTGKGDYNKKIHGSKYLITDVLKDKMGFDGFVVTDWNGHTELVGCTQDNCPEVINAGNDVIMVTDYPQWTQFYDNVIQQVKDDVIPIERINDAVRRILRVKLRANMWQKPKPSQRSLAAKPGVLGADEHRALARKAVRESLVLLKNNNILPLERNQKVILAGSALDNIQKQTGGWSITWQGDDNSLAEDFPGATTMKMAVTAIVGEQNIITELNEAEPGTVAIVVIGEDPYAEMFGDISISKTLEFSTLKDAYANDLTIIKQLKDAGMNIVTIFYSGRPLYVNEEINASDAFVAAWLPGTEAQGITDVIFKGNYDFRGRLSFSWPMKKCSTSINRIPPNLAGHYQLPETEQSIVGEHAPLFPYGYGLGYRSSNKMGVNVDLNALPLDPRNYGCGEEQDSLMTDIIFGAGRSSDYVAYLSDAYTSARPSDWQLITVSTNNETEYQSLTTTPFNYQHQQDALNLSFDGTTNTRFIVINTNSHGQDKSRYLKEDATLQLDIRVKKALEKVRSDDRLDLIVGSTEVTNIMTGVAKLDSILPSVSAEWTTIKIPLSCFADKGVNFAHLDVPVVIQTAGKLDLDIGTIRYVPRDIDPATDAVSCAEIDIDTADLDRTKNLSQGWLFEKGDNLNWAIKDLDDATWSPVTLPASWEDHSGYTENQVYGWYRINLNIPCNWYRYKDILLTFGNIDDSDHTYFNGIKVGQTGRLPDDPGGYTTGFDILRQYRVPVNMITCDEKNSIAVRVYDNFGPGGIVEGPLTISRID